VKGFFEKYASRIGPPTARGCRLWLGARSGSGYGNIKRGGKNWQAHVEAFESVHGPGSAIGKMIRHSCDIKLCVERTHLLGGTAQDNSDDAVARGLTASGERHPAAKLTRRIAARIKTAKGTQRDIAFRFGISQSQVSDIKTGKAWRA
jgi:hypothetical protein